MTSSSSFIGLDACITNVLADIRNYLDVESTVRLSQTCKTFHNLLAEDATGRYPKIKVTYFTFGDSSLWRDNRGRHIPESSVTKGVKIKSLATDVLPNIHWQSLKRIEFRLSPGRTFSNRDEELRDAFVYMAMGLESAHELEEFYIDVGHIMKFDTFNSKMIYEIFAKNLAKCKNLKRIKIFNHYHGQGGQSYFSNGFLLSLIPTIEARVMTLEEVTLLIGNQPTSQPSTKAYKNAAIDLFTAILKLQGLEELNLQLNLASSPLLNLFLQAAQNVYATLGNLPSKVIRKFMITCVLYKTPVGVPNPLPPPLSLAPCISLLGQSSSLYAFVIRIPPACWDTRCEVAMKDLLSGKPDMRHLGLYFHGYKSVTGTCLEYIIDYIQERENESDNLIHISGIEYPDRMTFDAEEALSRYYSREGQKCLSRDEKGLMFQAKGYMIGW